MTTITPIGCPEGLLLVRLGTEAGDVPVPDQAEAPSPPEKRGGGPQSPESSGAVRGNALKFGLMAKSVFPPDLKADIDLCIAEMVEQFQPTTPYQRGLVDELGRVTAQLQLCEELKVIDFQRGIDRAVLCWDEDRRDHVHALGARLARDPSRVSEALRRTKQGTDWCLERWAGLAEAAEVQGSWTDEQRRLAFDLLGVPLEFRATSRKVPDASEGAALAELAASEIARLGARLERSLLDVDEAMQAMAASGMPMEEDATTRSLRRSEAMLRRARDKARAELLRVRAEAAAPAGGPAPTPAPKARPIMNGAAQEFQIQKLRTSFDPTPILEDPDTGTPSDDTEWWPGAPAEEPTADDDDMDWSFLTRPVPADAAASQPLSPEERKRRDRRRKRNQEKQARKAARGRGR